MNCAFHIKTLIIKSEMVWYFIGVYIIIALTPEIFFNTRRQISYLCVAM